MESCKQQNTLSLDAVFPAVEDFIMRKKAQGSDLQSSRKRKFVDKFAVNPQAICTREWREAVIGFAENIPMALLIQEFRRYYFTTPKSKRICRGTSDQDSNLLVVKGKQKNCHVKNQLPDDILENIFLRIPLVDLLTCGSFCDDWAAVYASRYFQSVYDRTDKFILINNNNLDIWAFNIASSLWFEMKVPCNWDKLGMKTLGLKAACDGLCLVARSDLTLFVVNPLTAQFKSLPERICPHAHTRSRDKFLKPLIVHGTAEMQVNRDSGDYTIYLFGNWLYRRESCVHLARYTSTTKLWTMQVICMIQYANNPLSSTVFPSPLWSFCRGNVITCVSTTCQYFNYRCDNNHNLPRVMVNGNICVSMPIVMDFEYNNVSLPTILPYGAGRQILVGRLVGNNSVKPMYGRLPIVLHSELAIWISTGFGNRMRGNWTMIDRVQEILIKDMIKSSEGTDFLVVGNDGDSIWFLLRGSDIMLEFIISTQLWIKHEISWPGGGSLDANFHWKAFFAALDLASILDLWLSSFCTV